MTVDEKGSRSTLLRRGWYVASEVELAFMGLSGRAHDLLIILKHLQGANPDAMPRRERLAEILGTSVRTVQNSLNELRRKGAITTRRTGRASRHCATYGTATVAELRVLLGGKLTLPDELTVAEVQDPCTSEVQDLGSSPLYKEPPTKNEQNSSLREEGGQRHQQETEMGIRGASAPYRLYDEFDPAAALGNAQDDLSGLSDAPDGLFPASVSPSRSEARQRPARTQAQLDTPMALALEFDRQIRAADWTAGPAPVNRSALARNFSAWKRDGLSAGQIRAMIERYVGDSAMRSPNKTPWIDFVGKRHKLLAAGARAVQAQAVEDHRDADASYWLGSMAQ